MASKIELVGLGASTLDRFIVVPAFPIGREVQEAIRSTTDGGGPVSTALATAGRLGATAAIIDRIGNDDVGATIVEDFHKYNVYTDYVDSIDGAKSGVATILVDHTNGNRAVFFERSTAPELTGADMVGPVEDLITDAMVFHYNGRHKEAIPVAINIAKAHKVIVSLDGGAQRYDERMDQLARRTDLCIVARDFGENYTGTTDLMSACHIMQKRGATIAGITAGSAGSYFVWPDGTEYRCEPYKQEMIVDNTGCGDSFHGAFLYKLIEELKKIGTDKSPIQLLSLLTHSQLESCVRFASAVGSINTQTLGGRSGLPTLEQVMIFMNQE